CRKEESIGHRAMLLRKSKSGRRTAAVQNLWRSEAQAKARSVVECVCPSGAFPFAKTETRQERRKHRSDRAILPREDKSGRRTAAVQNLRRFGSHAKGPNVVECAFVGC